MHIKKNLHKYAGFLGVEKTKNIPKSNSRTTLHNFFLEIFKISKFL